MNQESSKLAALADALAKAQAEIKAPIKNRTVDFTHNGQRTKYSYADLADVIEAVKGPLSKNGIAVIHKMEYEHEQFGLRTALIHSSGDEVSTWHPLPDPSSTKPQSFGSSLTYARRYSLSSLVGIASEDDDDGQAAESPKPKAAFKPQVKEPEEFRKLREQNAQVDDLDAHLRGEVKPSPRDIALQALTEYVEGSGIPHEEVRHAIKLLTGSMVKTSRDLSEQELKLVLAKLKNG